MPNTQTRRLRVAIREGEENAQQLASAGLTGFPPRAGLERVRRFLRGEEVVMQFYLFSRNISTSSLVHYSNNILG